ncbi:MAG: DUF1990 domain-containing protein [Myxococcales bacterium]|nr:DUF1990 domain-containing protein [Myxococcales bacterium]
METLSRPSRAELDAWLAAIAERPLSYAERGRTRGPAPPGYWRNAHSCILGQGERVFERARACVQRWRVFELDWLELCWPERPVAQGTVVATLTRLLGVWTANPCRVVAVHDGPAPEQPAITRHEFAYGTLVGHGMRGEERFTVDWDRRDDRVRYEVASYSRPAALRTRVALPIVRRLQRRFVRESCEALTRAIAEPGAR